VLLAGFPAGEPPAELLAAAGDDALGGFVLFRRNLGGLEEVTGLCGRLIAAFPADAPPFLAVDQEGGRVQRLGPPVLQLPPARKLGEIDDPALTEAAAHLLGQQLAALGFNWDFAPVLDVDSNPDSPVIGDRSFGPEPARVVRHARAFARGLGRAGVAACGKHFPGHGDTALDSHFALPELAHDRARLERVELAPFAALAGELEAVMTAHIVTRALDPDRPATLSRTVMQGVLREQLGFGGLLVSDDLEMKAIADHFGIGFAACEAIAAGCDCILVCSKPELCLEARDALAERASGDPGFAARLHDAAARTSNARQRYRPIALQGAALRARFAELDAGAMEARIALALR
jgi:beta-N-acetylhexosaminidase